MGSSALELSVLKLTSPRKRLGQSARYSFENDLAQSLGLGNSIISPRKATESSPPWFADDDLFTIFEQHRAAIPFKWEATPGTCRNQDVGGVESQVLKLGMLSDSDQEHSSASSPTFTLSPSSSTNTSRTSSSRSSVCLLEESRVTVPASPEFRIKRIQLPSSATMTHTKENGCVPTLGDSGELCTTESPSSNGRALVLKPPPGMQSIKQLLSLECDDRGINTFGFSSRSVNTLINSGPSNSSSITSLKSHNRRSFRRDGLKALPFLSAPKEHAEDFLAATTMLGFEEWPKVVQQQEKQKKQQEKQQEKQEKKQEKQLQLQEETAQIKGHHHRTLSMPRLGFSFRKKSISDKESCGSDFQDADSIFSEDFGRKGGLRERKPFASVSSRTLADGYTRKTRNWVFADDADYSDSETDSRIDYFDSALVIVEEGEKEEACNDGTEAETPEGKRKTDALSRLRRIFKSSGNSSSISSGEQDQLPHQKPARLSSITPASPPPLALTQGELRLKKSSQQHIKQLTKAVSCPVLKMCMSNPIGQALLKNVRQLRSFEFHAYRPRALTAK